MTRVYKFMQGGENVGQNFFLLFGRLRKTHELCWNMKIQDNRK